VKRYRTMVLLLALACLPPAAGRAQDTAQATSPSPPAATDRSRLWLVAGGTSTTLRADCQEDCLAHGTGAYLHAGSIKGIVGYRATRHVNAGIELSWVPAATRAGDDTRSTFLLATAQFAPSPSRGLFLNAGLGMAFVRNFTFDGATPLPPVTSKALGLTYGVGWTFRRSRPLGVQIFGAQHMAAMGDFQTGGRTIENMMVNFWSVGAAIVIGNGPGS
jgi:hypothetical protein